jgi:hypothetical protein
MLFALPLIGAASAGSLQAQAAGNPACKLLTAADLKRATGQAYGGPTPAGELGQAAGGGVSCYWGDLVNEAPPMVSVVFIPASGKKSYTEVSRGITPHGCAHEPVSGIGDAAFVEICQGGDNGPIVYFRKGGNDGVVQIDVVKPATPASIKPEVIALAKAVATHMP